MKVAPLIGFPGRALTGTTIKENLSDPAVQVETLAAIEATFDPDIVFTIMDLSVEADSLRVGLEFPEDESPTVIEHPVKRESDLDALDRSGILDRRLKVFIDVVRSFKRRSTKELAAYAVGPFTLSALLMGAKEAAMGTIARKELLGKVLEFSTLVILEYASALKASGADYIVILEPTSVILSPAQFRAFSAPYVERIASEVGGDFVLHICGDSTHLFGEIGRMEAIGGVSLDSVVDLRSAYELCRKTVIGNVAPTTVSHGGREDIGRAASILIDSMRGVEDFVFSTGCDLPPETPLASISELIASARRYR